MPTCPNGHQSGSDDWCEVCGHRMAGSVPPPPPPPPVVGGYGFPPPAGDGPEGHGAPSGACPRCGTPREGAAPFCQGCRWNFPAEGAIPYAPAADHRPAPGPSSHYEPTPDPASHYGDGYDYPGSRPSRTNRPAEPIPPGRTGFDDGPSLYTSPPPPEGPGGGPYGFEPADRVPRGPHHQSPPAPGFPRPADGGAPSGAPHRGDDWTLPPPTSPGLAPGEPDGYGYSQPPHAMGRTATWTATIGPDRDYFVAMMRRSGPEAAGLDLPAYSPEQHRTLSGDQVTIGRRRHSTGDTPDIDLSVPPEDPGVSHQHALLIPQPGGGWAVVDQNSTNGTTVNGGEEPIQPYVPVPLRDGDRVHVGAWTTITVRRG
ncbi:FHA domain-containing protein [Streptomyces sp. HSG2]|uniref:FHA domain-containing protein n=1 Tax=Streptomyces sp. HSG2 TaxID=2797167 RepID=UPI0019056DA8|nr:FHA domain-containing protein [Streptomyces sp. HSG2]